MARERATKVRTQVEVGLDLVAERRKEAGIPTFKKAAALVFAEHKASWRNQLDHLAPEFWRIGQTGLGHGDTLGSKLQGVHEGGAIPEAPR
ncbi:MAG: hypothetical protein ACYCZB_13170 [Acidiphilium sp.]